MSNPALKRLLKKTGHEDILSGLDKLTLSELNSLLLEVFRRKAKQLSIKEISHAYKHNRFVLPSTIDPVSFLQMELQLLKAAQEKGFNLLELSPLAPLGSTSTVALVDQNKIVSALRGTEVVADATNVLALEAAAQRVRSSFDDKDIHLGSAHRHVRAQGLAEKGFTAHFKIFCAVSAGKDKGNYLFERQAMLKHIQLYHDYFVHILNKKKELRIIIKSIQKEGEENLLAKIVFDEIKSTIGDVDVAFTEVPQEEHRYYQYIRFSVNLLHNETEFNIGDGGLVDWSKKLTHNKKERIFTSGLGTELLWKILYCKL